MDASTSEQDVESTRHRCPPWLVKEIGTIVKTLPKISKKGKLDWPKGASPNMWPDFVVKINNRTMWSDPAQLEPEQFYRPTVIVWAPELFWFTSIGKIQCPSRCSGMLLF